LIRAPCLRGNQGVLASPVWPSRRCFSAADLHQDKRQARHRGLSSGAPLMPRIRSSTSSNNSTQVLPAVSLERSRRQLDAGGLSSSAGFTASHPLRFTANSDAFGRSDCFGRSNGFSETGYLSNLRNTNCSLASSVSTAATFRRPRGKLSYPFQRSTSRSPEPLAIAANPESSTGEDVLPALPPAWSRPLSPPSPSRQSLASTRSLWPPSPSRHAQSRSWSTSRSPSPPVPPPHGQQPADGMLRVVPITEWFYDAGMLDLTEQEGANTQSCSNTMIKR